METQLIVIRGNSGCGKTSVAHALRKSLDKHVMVVSQDVIRISVCDVKDTPDNISIELLETMVDYGIGKFDLIVLEGIMASKKYGDMLLRLQNRFGQRSHFFYLEIPFEETVKRHNTKVNPGFGIDDMKRWWLDHDVLNISQERVISHVQPLDETVHQILDSLNTSS